MYIHLFTELTEVEQSTQPETVYMMQTDNEANAYVTVAMTPETAHASPLQSSQDDPTVSPN